MRREKMWGQILGRVNIKEKGAGASGSENAVLEEQEGSVAKAK